MAQPMRSLGLSAGNRLFDIPGAPTVGRNQLGRFTKLSDEVVYYYKKVAADAINDFTDQIARRSLREVPKGPRQDPETEDFRAHAGGLEEGSLAASMKAPMNDYRSEATPEFLYAQISYDTPYAAVQHEGMATMVHHHPIIPGRQGFFERTGIEEAIVIEWRAESYTTPGTKDHYLSDPFKEAIPRMDTFIYERVRRAFAG